MTGATGDSVKGATGDPGAEGARGAMGMTGISGKGPDGPPGPTGPTGITGAVLPPALYQYTTDPIVLTATPQTVLQLASLQTEAEQNVVLSGNLRFTYLPLAVAVRIPVTIEILYNGTAIKWYDLRSIVQGYGSGQPNPNERASVEYPFSFTHAPEPGNGVYSVQVAINFAVPSNFSLTAESRYLLAEVVGGETPYPQDENVYFLAAGGVQTLNALVGQVQSVPMDPNIQSPLTAAYAATHGSDIYYAVKDRLYRFNTNAQTVDWGVDLNPGMVATDLLLTPDERYLFISDEASPQVQIYDLVNRKTVRTLTNFGSTFSSPLLLLIAVMFSSVSTQTRLLIYLRSMPMRLQQVQLPGCSHMRRSYRVGRLPSPTRWVLHLLIWRFGLLPIDMVTILPGRRLVFSLNNLLTAMLL